MTGCASAMKRFALALGVSGFALFLVLAVVPGGKLSAEKNPDTPENETADPSIRGAKKYLNNLSRYLDTYHIYRENISPEKLVRGAADGFNRAFQAEWADDLPAEKLKLLQAGLACFPFVSTDALVDYIAAYRKDFGESLSDEEFFEALDWAAAGLCAATGDPFTYILDEDSLRKVREMLTGGIDPSIGIGVRRSEDGRMVVGAVYWSSIGAAAGFRPGDVIISANGKAPETLTKRELVKLFIPEIGDKLEFVVERPGWNGLLTIKFEHRIYGTKNTYSVLLPHEIGYVRGRLFTMTFHKEVEKELSKLKGAGAKGIVLDLRGNPGGAINSAVGLADLFMGDDAVIARVSMSTSGNKSIDYRAKYESGYEDVPVVVLVDSSSASASELVSGALSVSGKAVLVGERTFGKWCGQSQFPLTGHPGGKRYLFLSLLTFHAPDGSEYNGVGFGVDHEVPRAFSDEASARETLRLFSLLKIEEYVRSAIPGDEDFFRRALIDPEVRLAQYPDTHKLAEIDTTLDVKTLAVELRRAASRAFFAADEFRPDLVDDMQLFSACRELLKLLALDPDTFPEYSDRLRKN